MTMRQPNTWMNPYTLNCKPIAKIRMRERRATEETAEYKAKLVQLLPYKTEYGGDFVQTQEGFSLGSNEMGYFVKQC